MEQNNLLEYRMTDRMLLRRIQREAVREALRLYQLTAGFTDPLPPDQELRQMFEGGMVEL